MSASILWIPDHDVPMQNSSPPAVAHGRACPGDGWDRLWLQRNEISPVPSRTSFDRTLVRQGVVKAGGAASGALACGSTSAVPPPRSIFGRNYEPTD
jgi:hypothetical protein